MLIAALFILAPSLIDWVMSGGVQWYRIFIVWGMLIAIIAWAQRFRAGDHDDQ